MTTSPLPGEFEFSDDDLALFGRVERVSDPGELIAAIPALLGFHPSNSVVALSLMGASASTLGPVMRHDYFPSVRGKPARQMSAALRQFAAVCDGEGARAVVLVVITDCSAAEPLIDETIELAEVFEGHARRNLRRAGRRIVHGRNRIWPAVDERHAFDSPRHPARPGIFVGCSSTGVGRESHSPFA